MPDNKPAEGKGVAPHEPRSGTHRARGRLSATIASLLLIVVSLVIALGVGEAVYRLLGYGPHRIEVNPNFGRGPFGWASPDPVLGWRNRAGTFKSAEPGHALMSFAPDGKRIDPAEKPGASRVIVIGGSYTQGYGVNDTSTYTHFLNLQYGGRLANYGVGGYGTYQSLLLLRRLLRHAAPKIVIYGLIGDHSERNVATNAWIHALTTQDGHYYVPPHIVRIDGKWQEKGGAAVPIWPLERRSALVAAVHDAVLRFMHSPTPEEALSSTAHLVTELQRTATRGGAKLLVVDLANVPIRLAHSLEKGGIDYIDCTDPDLGKNPNLRTGGTWGHPTRPVHAYWARCISRRLGPLLSGSTKN